MGQVELADHDLDIRTKIVFVTQNLNHASARILRGRGPVGDLDVYHDIFHVVPSGAARGFLSQHAVRFLSLLARVSASVGGFGKSASRDFHSLRDHNFLRNFRGRSA